MYRIIIIIHVSLHLLFFFNPAGSLAGDAPRNHPHLSPETKALLKQALESFLRDDRGGVKSALRKIQHSEQERLIDNLSYLESSMEPDPRERYQRLRDIRGDVNDDICRASLDYMRERDEYRISRKLLRENFYNHTTMLLNHFSSAATSLANGRISPLFQLPIDLVYSIYKMRRITPREKKSLFLLRRFQDKEPRASQSKDVEVTVEKLLTKKRKEQLKEEITRAEIYLESGKPYPAIFHIEKARELKPEDDESKQLLHRVQVGLSRKKAGRESSLGVMNGEGAFISPSESRIYGKLVIDLVMRNDDAFRRNAFRHLREYSESNYVDDVKYAMTSLRDYNMDRREILDKMKELCARHPESNIAHHAKAALEDQSFNIFRKRREAEKQLSRNFWKYVITGRKSMDEHLYIAGTSFARSPEAGGQNWGVFLAMDMFYRLIVSMFRDPVPFSQEKLIEASADIIRESPGSPDNEEILEYLADIHEKRKEYDVALEYAKKMHGAPEKRVQKLQNRRAKKLFLMIKEVADRERRVSLFGQLIDEYPDSPIVKEAKKELQKSVDEAVIDFRITKKELVSDPDILLMSGFSLESRLTDGDVKNAEMSSEGLIFIEEGPVVYRMEGDGPARKKEISGEVRQALKKRIQQLRLTAEAAGGEESVFPLEIRGGVGSSGVDVYPFFSRIPYQADDLELFR